MTDEGVKKINLYPFQKDLLKSMQDNRYSIILASRQVGKCFFPISKLQIKNLQGFDNYSFFKVVFCFYFYGSCVCGSFNS